MDEIELKKIKADKINSYIAHCNGSEKLYFNPLCPKIKYTSGMKYVAEVAEAYWLIDFLLLQQQFNKKIRQSQRLQEIQMWVLKRQPDSVAATLCCYEDIGPEHRPKVVHRIGYTDFPMDELQVYVENKVILLPAER